MKIALKPYEIMIGEIEMDPTALGMILARLTPDQLAVVFQTWGGKSEGSGYSMRAGGFRCDWMIETET